MINLALNDDDKKNFITAVLLDENGDNLSIIYADNHVVEEMFDVDRLNDIWCLMEEQFWKYKDDFVKRCNKESLQAILKSIFESILAVGSLYFTCSIEMPIVLKGLIIIFISWISIYYQRIWSLESKINNYLVNKVGIIERFLENKDKFKIQITDSRDGKKHDWYLLTLSGIDEVPDIRTLNLIGKSLTTEVKEDERKNTERFLSKKMVDFR